MGLQAAASVKHGASVADFALACHHCGSAERALNGSGFCCSGCESAYDLIRATGLDQFYSLPDLRLDPVELVQKDPITLDYFDHPQILQRICRERSDERLEIELQVGGLTCFACAWLIEASLRQLDNSINAVINLRRQTMTLVCNPDRMPLSKIIARIYQLGFSVKIPTVSNQATLDGEIVRLGVACFCAMNVMLLSFSDYLASESLFSSNFYNLFRYLSLALCVACLSFAASGFYQRAWQGLRQKSANIDQPIVLALSVAFIFSLVNTATGLGFVYYDSITIIVLLLLVGRTFQSFVLDRARLNLAESPDLSMEFTRRLRGDSQELIEISEIELGDGIVVGARETVPVRCLLEEKSGYFSLESLTGEAKPKHFTSGEKIPAGAVCLGDCARLRSDQNGSESYLLQLMQQRRVIKHSQEEHRFRQDRFATPFLLAISLTASSVFAYFFGSDPLTGINRAMAVLLIACPCAIAFASPLVLSLLESKALKSGLVISSPTALEKLAQVRQIFWDKTGTLTRGASEVVKFEIDKRYHHQLMHLNQLINFSQHHVIKALADWSGKQTSEFSSDSVEAFKERIGFGVEYFCGVHQYHLGSASHCRLNGVDEWANVWLTRDDEVIGKFLVVDHARDEATQVVGEIKKAGIEQYIISGDKKDLVTSFGRRLGLPVQNCFYEMSPEAKLEKMSGRTSGVAMVGNGFNDSLVLAKADVGITVPGAHLAAVHLSDVHVSHGDLRGVTQVLRLASAARRRFRLITAFAITYNSAALVAAVFGFITPFAAAVLMPLSSITVVAIAAKG